MRVLSVNVSPGKVVKWRGASVETGIFKEPVTGRVAVHALGLDGDRQVDLRVHGGEHKAVYAYSAEHYLAWRAELGRDLPHGMFGENLTVEGLGEDETWVGDVLRVGSAVLEAVQPRLPCFKLGMRFGDPAMVKRFMKGGRYGIYFRVIEEGMVGVGDEVTYLRRDPGRVPVPELVRLADARTRDPVMTARALAVPALAPGWLQTLRGGPSEGDA